jgi:hypothetical protein
MAIVSHDFGGLRLSGDDARKFVRQVETARKTKRASKTISNGLKLAAEFNRKGAVRVISRARVKTKA